MGVALPSRCCDCRVLLCLANHPPLPEPAVIVSLGEGIYTRSQLKQNAKGRPAMLTLITTTLALAAVRAEAPDRLHLHKCLCARTQQSAQGRHAPQLSCPVMQALGLLAQGQQKTGLAVGTVVSAALLLLDIKRAYDVGTRHSVIACTTSH